jgi:hypothetical protein
MREMGMSAAHPEQQATSFGKCEIGHKRGWRRLFFGDGYSAFVGLWLCGLAFRVGAATT